MCIWIFFQLTVNIDDFTEEGKGCVSEDFRPIPPFYRYVEVPLSACKYLCQYQHDAVCTMVLYLPNDRSCYLYPLREPVGDRQGCGNAIWYRRHRILGKLGFIN